VGIDLKVGVSCHRDRRWDAHFGRADGIEMPAVGPMMMMMMMMIMIMMMLVQDLLRCGMEVPEEALIVSAMSASTIWLGRCSHFESCFARPMLRCLLRFFARSWISARLSLNAIVECVDRSGAHHCDFGTVEPA
jgi:hypothetical protein